MAAHQSIVMIGPSLDSPGGMSAVAATYRDAGFFAARDIRFLDTWRSPSWPSKIMCFLGAAATFAWLLLARRVRLLHAHTAARGSFWRKSVFVGMASLAGIPVVLHVHSGEFMRFFYEECGALRRAIVRWVLRRSSRVLCLTGNWSSRLAQIEPRGRYEVLGNPVEIDARIIARRQGGSAQRGHVLFLGRLRGLKGVYELLRAWPSVKAAVPEARMTMAGDGDLDEFEAIVRREGVADSVAFPGWVAGGTKADLLAGCDVFVLPSHAEGMPVCVLEAMAYGIPVVATTVGGIPDIATDGEDALLIPPKDAEALARALIRALGDDALRLHLARGGRLRVEANFRTALVTSRLGSIYDALLDAGKA